MISMRLNTCITKIGVETESLHLHHFFLDSPGTLYSICWQSFQSQKWPSSSVSQNLTLPASIQWIISTISGVYYQPKQCIAIREILQNSYRIVIELYILYYLIPPTWVFQMTPGYGHPHFFNNSRNAKSPSAPGAEPGKMFVFWDNGWVLPTNTNDMYLYIYNYIYRFFLELTRVATEK